MSGQYRGVESLFPVYESEGVRARCGLCYQIEARVEALTPIAQSNPMVIGRCRTASSRLSRADWMLSQACNRWRGCRNDHLKTLLRGMGSVRGAGHMCVLVRKRNDGYVMMLTGRVHAAHGGHQKNCRSFADGR
jgi:hypothetical protein